jgi:LysR family transcriptional regulator, low CO2-responsive transcriptional regulator
MAITMTQLRSFLAVAETGSVTAAADELYVTQPSVSAAVSALSRELGADLTERLGRSVGLSPAGTAFAPFAAHVIGLLDQGGRAAREAAGAAARELRIAAVTTAAEYIVPQLVREFSARRPELTLTLDVGNRERVFREVANRRADVAIGGRPPTSGQLSGEPFLDNPILLVTAPDDPLARRRSVPVEELGARPWLLREPGSGTRAMTEEFLAANELDPRLLTMGSNGAIKQAARAGLGVSLQSRAAAALELETGLLDTIALREPLPTRQWFVLSPSSGPLRAPAREFLDFVTSTAVEELVEGARGTAPGLRPPRPRP